MGLDLKSENKILIKVISNAKKINNKTAGKDKDRLLQELQDELYYIIDYINEWKQSKNTLAKQCLKDFYDGKEIMYRKDKIFYWLSFGNTSFTEN